MRVRSAISFCGSICMAAGEVRDIPEGGALDDLLAAGYVIAEPEYAAKKPEQSTEKRRDKNEAKRGKS